MPMAAMCFDDDKENRSWKKSQEGRGDVSHGAFSWKIALLEHLRALTLHFLYPLFC